MLAVSPDGAHLYVAGGVGNAVAVFSRNATTGQLRFLEAEVDGVSGVTGLHGAWSVAVSPDGAHVYATGLSDGAVVAFRRDPSSGGLAFVEAKVNGVGGVAGLAGAWLVTVSPDGANVYVAGSQGNAIAVFGRDPTTGALTFLEAQSEGAGGVDGLADARGVTVSPDGRHVYATGASDDAVALFRRVVCGDGLVEADECCDLGASNGAPGSGCTATCGCTGLCTRTERVCASAADCPPGEGCCGNALIEEGEECDDGNLQDGDCCTSRCTMDCGADCVPTCEHVFGPHLGAPLRMRLRLGGAARDGTFHRWRLSHRRGGEATLNLAPAADLALTDVRIVLAENAGGCPPALRVLGDFRLDADQCGGAPCWDRCSMRSGTEQACSMRDGSETRSEPDGIRLARISERAGRLRFTFSGKALARILRPRSDRLRACVYLGTDARTHELRCVREPHGAALACRPVKGGPGRSSAHAADSRAALLR